MSSSPTATTTATTGSPAPRATVGILSMGDMGTGVARLLLAHGYVVWTNLEGRSQDTKTRAQRYGIYDAKSDSALVQGCDYILSIVPPRDAHATARRVAVAAAAAPDPRPHPLYYLDLNAVAPRTARNLAAMFEGSLGVVFIDGGIIGGPPAPMDGDDEKEKKEKEKKDTDAAPGTAWKRPSIPLSGPSPLAAAPVVGAHLAQTLNTRHLTPRIGSASGLKCCYASITKGLIGLGVQALTTAGRLGVLPELERELSTRNPALWAYAVWGVTSTPPKAYRWVREMEEIGGAHADEGGFAGGSGLEAAAGAKESAKGEGEGSRDTGVFDAFAELYRAMAEDTVLGEETTERRKRGLTFEDVAEAMGEGLERKRKKRD